MICNLIRFAFGLACVLLSPTTSSADIIFNLTDSGSPVGTIIGNQFTLVRAGLTSGGVTFDATLTVVANQAFIGYASGGMGAGTTAGQNSVDPGESLSFTMSIGNFVGGSVVFNGFTRLYFSSFGSFDRATLNQDGGPGDTLNGSLSSFGLSNPSFFTISGQQGGFQVRQVDALFTGTTAAVPEPSGFIAVVLATCATSVLRRFRRRANSVDSKSLVA